MLCVDIYKETIKKHKKTLLDLLVSNDILKFSLVVQPVPVWSARPSLSVDIWLQQ